MAYKKYAKKTYKKNQSFKKAYRKAVPGTSFKGRLQSTMLRSTPSKWAATSSTGGRELKCVDVPDLPALPTPPGITGGGYPLTINLTTNTNVFLLNGVQEGAGFYNRIGRKIVMKSLEMTGFLGPSGNATTGPDYIRWAIVYDRQPSGAALPSYDTIFKDYDQNSTAYVTNMSNINPDNRERFIVLRDFQSQMPVQTAVGTNPGAMAVSILDNKKNLLKEFIKLRDLETHYGVNAIPLVIASITTGSLLLVTQGEETLGTQGWSLHAKFRLRYTD